MVGFTVEAQNNMGVDEPNPASKLSVRGNSSIGSSYSTIAAPTNGAIIQGNVGIGTSVPNSQLEINGNSGSTLKITDGNQGAAKVLTSDANGNASWQAIPGVSGPTGAQGSTGPTGPSGINGWLLSGNPSTTPGTNFIGTTDANALVFKTNSSEAMRILSGGNIGIGTTSPLGTFDVRGTSINLKSTSVINSIASSYDWGGYDESRPTGTTNFYFGRLSVMSPNISSSSTGSLYIGSSGTAYIGTSGKNYSNTASAVNQAVVGLQGAVYLNTSSGTVSGAVGVSSTFANLTAGAVLTNAYGFLFDFNNFVSNNGTTTNLYAFYEPTQVGHTGVPAASNRWGLYLADPTQNYFAGSVGIGVTSPTSSNDINGANGYNQLRLRKSYTPSSSADSNGNVGDMAWDANYIYVKTSSGWMRSSLTSF